MVGKPRLRKSGKVLLRKFFRTAVVADEKNMRWSVSYYRHLALGASSEEAYIQADYESGIVPDKRPWYESDYKEVFQDSWRSDFIGV